MDNPPQTQRRTCCFCLSLKSGSYLAAGYALLFSLLGVVGSLLILKVYLPMATERAADKYLEEHPDNLFTREDIIELVQSASWAYWFAVALYGTWFLISLLLILGVATRRRGLQLLFVIYTCVVTGLCGIGLIHSLINARTTFADSTGVVTVVILVILLLLNLYAIWCVAMHMRELKEAENAGAVVSLAPMNPPQYNPPAYGDYNKCPDYYVKQ